MKHLPNFLTTPGLLSDRQKVFTDGPPHRSYAAGRECVAGNYGPCWEKHVLETYMVKGKWPEDLWKQRKLSNETYEKYLFLCRDGVVTRKRNSDAVIEREQVLAEQTEMTAVTKQFGTIRSCMHLSLVSLKRRLGCGC